ncbi:hypothetical protein QHI69_00070 [Burkholderia gladioli pv. gladioli]|uniref:Membrane protein n=1 Tax=Burkholderia gladioli TaxID=28095 RepID=A0A095F250_BURGA|nr:hypothetical protein [Burkholderia gladioli]AJW97715.1 putative membrane protein [Burkholderia gladioli]ASD80021.1 hypothetical protein CEJ98_14220 [Burkholderia gladioli pv. gladioli]AWY54732.1 hypothetical protein A8H28_26910 [Burkholderia gladioli pv. gladioli]KGC11756.1 putative membrane protein [Burkholderia gladioli]MDJ1160301.1 hypothetical protein [Burkholderia gladioli pv. gladioli]
MGWLKLALIINIVIGVAKGIQLFNQHCRHRFGHTFFTMRGFWLTAIAVNLIWWGMYFWARAIQQHTPTSDGIILMAFGLAATGWLLYENIRDTDLLHGVSGSSLQVALFFPLAICSFPLLIVAMVIMVVASYKAGPALFIDR